MQTVASTRETDKREATGIPTLQEALRYAERGWLVLPLHNPTMDGCSCRKSDCQSAGKHPRTATGLKEASTDVATIRGWWAQWPEANVGIATGPESGLWVLDIDGEEGQASLRALEASHWLPVTLRALTGRTGATGERTGAHLYFTHPDGANLRNSAGLLGKGLDIRAAGGYVVAPPSLHASGLRYEWDGEAIQMRSSSVAHRQSIEAHSCYSLPPDKAFRRESETIHCSPALAPCTRAAWLPPLFVAALQEENRQRCSPPLPEDEVLPSPRM